MDRTVVCFSRPVNLRCSGLSHLQSVAILIPPAVQLLAAIFLAVSIGRRRLKNSLIFIEAFVTFALAAGDFGLHEAARNATPSFLNTFEVADRAIGALSSIPLLSFSVFLVLYLNAFVLPFVNPIFSNICRYSFAILIPLIFVFNELGGLLAMAYGVVGGAIAQGFTDVNAQMSSHTFALVTLAMLLAIQLGAGIVCSLLMYHMDRIERLGGAIPGTYPNATTWFTVGVSLGAAEVLVTFVEESFVTILVRRVLVVLSRLLVIISLTKQSYGSPIPPLRRGYPPLENKLGLRPKISNPRYSTFAHLNTRVPDPTRSLYDIGANDNNAMSNYKPQRVTVMYDRVNPPTLEMRLSTISLPTVDRALATVRKPSVKSNIQSLRANASLYRYRPEYFPDDSPWNNLDGTGINADGSQEAKSTAIRSTPPRAMTTLDRNAKLHSIMSNMSSPGLSVVDESLELATVRGLAVQFPDTPKAVARSAIKEDAGYGGTSSTPWPYVLDQNSQSMSGGQSTMDPGRWVSWGPARDILSDTDMSESERVSRDSTSTFAPRPRHRDSATQSDLESATYSAAESMTPRNNGAYPQLAQIDGRHDSTAGLAPRDVFIDRFVEQREARARSRSLSTITPRLAPPQSYWSATGSTTSVRVSPGSSPSDLPRPESYEAGTTDFSEDEDTSPPRATFVEIDSRRTTPSAVELPNNSFFVEPHQAHFIGIAVTKD